MLNKLILRIFLSLSLAFSCAGTANATLITQDILFNSFFDNEDTFEVIGNVAVDTDNIDDWGFIENTWESFSFYGYDVDPFDPSWNIFVAVFDVSNIMKGIESLDFDVTLLSDLSFAGYIDVYDPINSVTFSLFDNADNNLYDAGALAFGKATAVPLPATLMLFLTGILGLVVRRKNS
jgi:hypothetical protein